jgi:hypothetical protein
VIPSAHDIATQIAAERQTLLLGGLPVIFYGISRMTRSQLIYSPTRITVVSS